MDPAPEIFGLLVTKNEAPILKDVLDVNTQFIKKIFVLDGGNDNAENIFRAYPEVVYYLHENELEKKIGKTIKVVDGIRGYLYDEILKVAKMGDWITLMHGDEIFYNDPTEVVACAEKKGANLVSWFAAHFFPHVNDYPVWNELKNKQLLERFRYFACYEKRCWVEDRQFKILDTTKYRYDRHGELYPKFPTAPIRLNAFPLYHHYKVWDLDKKNYQTELFNFKHKRPVLHPKDKWSTVHYYPLTFKDFFRESYPDYPSVGYFDGSFGKLEDSYALLRQECLADKASGLGTSHNCRQQSTPK